MNFIHLIVSFSKIDVNYILQRTFLLDTGKLASHCVCVCFVFVDVIFFSLCCSSIFFCSNYSKIAFDYLPITIHNLKKYLISPHYLTNFSRLFSVFTFLLFPSAEKHFLIIFGLSNSV